MVIIVFLTVIKVERIIYRTNNLSNKFKVLISDNLLQMLKSHIYIPAILLSAFVTSCKTSINPEELYGKWNYIKVEQPSADPPVTDSTELKKQTASIEFFKNNDYAINWGGKVLSHGHFTVDGRNIQIKEILPDGTTRGFPFWVTELTAKKIVFNTKGADGSTVTAAK